MATFAEDTFTDADNTQLEAHAADDGGTWTEHGSFASGSIQIHTNRARQAASFANSLYYHSGTPGGANPAEYDVEASIDVLNVTSDFFPAVVGRVDPAANTYYEARQRPSSTNAVFLMRVVAGTLTTLASVSSVTDIAADNVMKLEIRDATKKVFINGVELLSNPDNTITAAGRAGIRFGNGFAASTTNGQQFISFIATDLAAGGLEAVGRDVAIAWDTRQFVGRGAVADWNVHVIIGRDGPVDWNTRVAIGRAADTAWHAFERCNVDVDLAWRLAAALGRVAPLGWDTSASVGRDTQLAWNDLVIVGRVFSSTWHLLTVVGRNTSVAWHVAALSGLSAVGRELPLEWSVLAPVGRVGAMNWHVMFAIGIDAGVSWNLTGLLDAPLNRIVVDRAVMYMRADQRPYRVEVV